MANEVKEGTNTEKGGTKKRIICIVMILILIGVIVALVLWMNRKEEASQRNVVVNTENVEAIVADMQEVTPIGYYEASMNSTWYFDNGAAASENAYVENPQSNTNSVYFDVVRSDTDETIFSSPILPVGAHLENFTLDEELPEGTYSCVCTYYLLDEEEQPVSLVNVSVMIVVRN